jgi:hypothetical protein
MEPLPRRTELAIFHGMQDAIDRQKTRRRRQVVGIAAILFTGFGWAHPFGGCKISDWPLDIADGPDGWVGTFRSAAANPPRSVVHGVTRGPRIVAAVAVPATIRILARRRRGSQ